MAPAFKMMDSRNLMFVEAMLSTHIESEESQVRLVSVQVLNDLGMDKPKQLDLRRLNIITNIYIFSVLKNIYNFVKCCTLVISPFAPVIPEFLMLKFLNAFEVY